MQTPTEGNTMSLKDQYQNQAQSDLDAATALACDLAEGDPSTFKAGYSPANAAIAAAEVFGLDEQDKLWIERAVAGRSIGRANPQQRFDDLSTSGELQRRAEAAKKERYEGRANPITPAEDYIDPFAPDEGPEGAGQGYI
jgi:hypothetical protein